MAGGEEAWASAGQSGPSDEPLRLVLQAVDIEGFKSYHGSVRVGAPFGQFACVVGSNGAGKSVVGEAIAFALGGSSRMMRAKNLGSLVNSSLAGAGAQAQVTVHFSVTSAGSSTSSQAGSAAIGYLGVRRRVTRAGRSDFAVCTVLSAAEAVQAAAAAVVEAANSGSDSGAFDVDAWAARGRWRAVGPEALQQQLAGYGIQTQAIERLVVTQHRHAVSVQDPARLARFLELLIGTGGYEEQVRQLQRDIEATCTKQDEAEDDAERLEQRRQALAPEVAKWRRYEAERRGAAALRERVLGQQAGLLERQAGQLAERVAGLQGELREATSAQAAAKTEADQLLAERAVAAKALATAETAGRKLAKQVEAQQAECSRLGVRVKAAQQAAKKSARPGGGQLQGDLGVEIVALREELVRQQITLQELAEQEDALAQQASQLAAESGSSALGGLQASLDTLTQQLSALDALVAAQLLLAQQQAAAAAAAEKEQGRHAEAEAAAAARQAEAEGEAARLREGVAEGQRALAAKERELEGARAEQYASQVALDQLQQELAALDGQLQQLAPEAHGAPGTHSSAGPSRQSVSEAVAELMQQAQRSELPGGFHGRLCNVARLAQAGAAPAVNAVLMELCNLSTCFVVPSRAVAQRVVKHFGRHQVGLATCKILEELQEPPRDPVLPDGLAPLQQLVIADAGAAPGSDALLRQMLRGWYMAPTRQAAVEAVRRDRNAGGRRRNIVTEQGELFKAEGELVGARPPPAALQPCLLTTRVQPLAAGTAAAAPHSGAELAEERQRLGAQRADLAARAAQQEQQLQCLEERAARLGEEAAVVGEREREDRAKLRAAERLVKQEQAQGPKLRRHGEQLRQALSRAQAAQAAAAAALSQVTSQRQALLGQHAAAQTEYEAAAGQLLGGGELLRAKAELATLQGQLAQAREKAAGLEDQLAQLTQRQQRQERAAAAVAAAEAEAGRLQQQLEAAAQAVAMAEATAQQREEAAAELKQRLGTVDKNWKGAVRWHERATAAVQALRAQLLEAQRTQRAKAAQLSQAQEALAAAREAVALLAAAAAAEAAAVGEVDGPAAPAVGAGAGSALGSEEGDAAGSGSYADGPPKRARLAAAVPASSSRSRGQRRRRSALPGRDSANESEDAESSWAAEEPQQNRTTRSMAVRSYGPVEGAGSDSDAGTSRRPAAKRRASAAASGRAARRTAAARRSVIVESSDSDSDFEAAAPARSRPPAASAAVSARPAASRHRGASAAATGMRSQGEAVSSKGAQWAQQRQRERRSSRRGGGSDSSVEDGEEAGAWGEAHVEAGLEELEGRERRLQALKASLLEGAVESERAAAAALAVRLAKLEALDEELARLRCDKAGVEAERYDRFHAAMRQVNPRLSSVYQQLTGDQGDAYCSYVEDRLAVFAEGVTFHVRPDSGPWRAFSILSGGQQALATLALCFALQAASPSPCYFFDEIDCALDTVNAGRVASFIRSQRDAQYVVVSHKPQVYERASCLIGVYTLGAGSDAVTAHFEAAG